MTGPESKQPVYITIESTAVHQQETSRHKVDGDLYAKNGLYYLLYQEKEEPHNSVQNTLIIGPQSVRVRRQGSTRMNQLYEQGKKTQGKFVTPEGSFRMLTDTELVTFKPPRLPNGDSGQVQGELQLNYRLTLNEEDVGHFRLRMHLLAYERA